jgi:hypothetical protein
MPSTNSTTSTMSNLNHSRASCLQHPLQPNSKHSQQNSNKSPTILMAGEDSLSLLNNRAKLIKYEPLTTRFYFNIPTLCVTLAPSVLGARLIHFKHLLVLRSNRVYKSLFERPKHVWRGRRVIQEVPSIIACRRSMEVLSDLCSVRFTSLFLLHSR